jgi:TPP-dependent pyruvate/acetoin dehydrogenase alpha subunit
MVTLAEQTRSAGLAHAGLSNQERLDLCYYMKLARECDNAILRLYKQGKIVGGAYTGYGNEATAVGAHLLWKTTIIFCRCTEISAPIL